MKTYIFVADGSEVAETMIPLDLLRRAGIETYMVSIKKEKEICASNKVVFMADMSIEDGEFLDADAIILPGGIPGVDNLYECSKLLNIIKDYNDDKKLVAAICAAPSILGREGLLEGKKATCYPSFEKRFISGEYTGEKVEVQDNIITAKGLGAAFEFSTEIITYLLGEDMVDKVLQQIMYK